MVDPHHTQNYKSSNKLRKLPALATTAKTGRLWNGPGTYEVPTELFSTNRDRLVQKLRSKVQGKAVVLLQGGREIPLYETDISYGIFRQESFFMWAFGVTEPGCCGAIDVTSGAAYLFVPRLSTMEALQKGAVLGIHNYSKKYQIPHVTFLEDIGSVLKSLNPVILLTLRGLNVDSNLVSEEASFIGIDKFRVDNTILYDEMAELRVFKTEFEIDIMKYVNDISSEAHRNVMRFAKPGKTEYQCESEFLHYCYSTGGCRNVAFTCVCASNGNAAYLSYGGAYAPNNKVIEPGDLLLCQMGANYFGYCADITCTFPPNGKFTNPQRVIYEAVLLVHYTVFKVLKPGVSWVDMHMLGLRTLLTALKKAGLLRGDVEAMMDCGLGTLFQSHGLGHFVGLDVHDVGGFLGSTRMDQKNTASLRLTRILQERMVLTLGPGCYFVKPTIDQALGDSLMSRFMVPDNIKKFRGFGGCRIEDTILITKTGAVSLTKVPRTVDEIEDWLAGRDNSRYSTV